MLDVRRIIVIFVIAVLFTILVNVSIDAFYDQPQYDKYCRVQFAKPMPVVPAGVICDPVQPSQELYDSCTPEKGQISYKMDSRGCSVEPYCEPCSGDFNRAQERYNFIVFLISAIAGLAALIVGLHLPQKNNPINEWVGSGFLLGGLITIFVGTARYFGDMGRYVRPVVILIELILVVYLAYKKLGKK